MIQRPLMTPDELKTLKKGNFIVTKTGAYPMIVKLKLFIDWGIKFDEPYRIKEQANRKVVYADKQELEDAIKNTYGSDFNDEVDPTNNIDVNYFEQYMKDHKTKVRTD